jgi:F0F1-type ATP synthase assembly protein I
MKNIGIRTIFTLSSWGFTIVITSLISLYLGYHIDGLYGTEPMFMLGLFVLAIFLTIGKLYKEAWRKKDIK